MEDEKTKPDLSNNFYDNCFDQMESHGKLIITICDKTGMLYFYDMETLELVTELNLRFDDDQQKEFGNKGFGVI